MAGSRPTSGTERDRLWWFPLVVAETATDGAKLPRLTQPVVTPSPYYVWTRCLASSKSAVVHSSPCAEPPLATCSNAHSSRVDVGRNSAAVIHRSHGLHAAIRSSDKLTGTIASDRLNLQDSDIPDLLTTKIIGGTFDVARIPSLSTAQITSGTFAASFIPTLSSLSLCGAF